MKCLNVILPVALAIVGLVSCKKSPVANESIIGSWKWVALYGDRPDPIATPQSTGINEELILNKGIRNVWYLLHNNSQIHRGTFKLSTTTGLFGVVNCIHYYDDQNPGLDSVCYYQCDKDSLVFSHDFIGTSGSGARIYGRE